DVEPLAAGVLHEALQPRRFQPVPNLFGRLDDRSPADIGAGIQIHVDEIRLLEIVELRAPRMDLENAALHEPEQARKTVYGDDRFVGLVLRIVHLEDLRRLTAPGMLLKEALAADAVGAPHERQWPIDDEGAHAGPDLGVIVV